MHFEFKRFQREHYTEYASWFVDPELNRHLGPMDEAWLEAVLAQPESEGVTWSVFRGSELVAVVETNFDPQNQSPAVIKAIAIKPTLRRQGIGSSVLQRMLSIHNAQGFVEHLAYISVNNPVALHLVEKAGFIPVTAQPDEHGFIWFYLRQSPM